MKSVLAVTLLALAFTSLAFSLTGCGMHVTSDPVKVKHEITFDVQAFIDYCEMVCNGDQVCFQDCARRFIDLLNDPEICVDLNTCPR
jgi:hypothetical protein